MTFRLPWYEALLRIVVITAPLWSNDFYLRLLPSGLDELRITLDVIIYIVWQSSLIFLAHRAGWFRWGDLGLEARRLWLRLLFGLGVYLALMVGFIILRFSLPHLAPYVQSHIGIDITAGGHAPLPRLDATMFFLYVFYLSVTAGVFEEVVYRGFVLLQLQKAGWPAGLAVIFSAIVFAGVHWSLGPAIWILAAVYGLFWGILYHRFRSLVPLMVSHFLFDFTSFYGWNDRLLVLLFGFLRSPHWPWTLNP